MPSIKPGLLRLWVITTLLLTTLWALRGFTLQGEGSGQYFDQYSRQWVIVFIVVAMLAWIELSLLVFSLTQGGSQRLLNVLKKLERIHLPGWLVWLAGVAPVFILTWLVFWRFNIKFSQPTVRLWLFWHCVIVGAFFLWRTGRFQHYFYALVSTTILYGLAFNAAAFFTPVSSFPFSLDWSEGSRYYNASLFFAQSLYGRDLALPVLHPTRYLLQSVPFIIPDLGIAFHRLWQAILWVGMTLLGSAAVVRRMKIKPAGLVWLAMGWSFLFLLAGPVYYHLIPCAALVLFGFDRRRFLQTTLVVLLASVWAGLSRMNWFPVPGLMAAVLFVLETRLDAPVWKYVWKPAFWSLTGMLVAYGSSQIYQHLSGNPPEVFGSAFESPLLWNRLLPNPTYPDGLLLSALILFLPVLFVIGIIFWQQRNAWHPLRILGLGGILGVFLVGGLVVSVKVGGGSNLHNMDGFMVFLLVVLGYLVSQQAVLDQPVKPLALAPAYWVLLLVFLISLSQVFNHYPPNRRPAQSAVDESLSLLKASLDQLQPGDEVLFINERQLLMTEPYHHLNFEERYELVFLMEMAMSGNRAYLDQFHQNLAEHRYKLIVVETLQTQLQDSSKAFSEENNLWVKGVSIPVLQYYRVRSQFKGLPVVIMEPIP
jgi:hypothetical protein